MNLVSSKCDNDLLHVCIINSSLTQAVCCINTRICYAFLRYQVLQRLFTSTSLCFYDFVRLGFKESKKDLFSSTGLDVSTLNNNDDANVINNNYHSPSKKDNSSNKSMKMNCFEVVPARLVLYFLSWSGFLVSFMMRNDINFALVVMVKTRNATQVSLNGNSTTNSSESPIYVNYTSLMQSCCKML